MNTKVKVYPGQPVPGFYNEKYDRPDRNLIVTGIPRSGTSLFSTLLNEIPNVYCMNEILYNLSNLPMDMAVIRRSLINGQAVPNKYKDGKLATNTGTEKSQIEILPKVIDKLFDDDCVVGSNVNLPYLNNIQFLLMLKYKIIAIVRDPIYTIASWQTENCKEMQIHNLMGEDLYQMFWHIPITAETNTERQAQVWNHYAGVIWKLVDEGMKMNYFTYEDIMEQADVILETVACDFDIDLKDDIPLPPLKNQNTPERYPDINLKAIKDAVKEHCPNRELFGYD